MASRAPLPFQGLLKQTKEALGGVYRRLASARRLAMVGAGLPLPSPPLAKRRERILKHVSKTMKGVEIGPYCNPLAPKREGYDCLSMDVYPTEELRRRAAQDPNIPPEQAAGIEEVDLVGSASDFSALIAGAVGKGGLDYIVSSHNLEHIPDPVRFLQGCAQALRPGGWLPLAIPDLRCCFDFFRWPSTLTDWLDAYFEGRERPTPAQVFASHYARAHMRLRGGHVTETFYIGGRSARALPLRTVAADYQGWVGRNAHPSEVYIDAHCWTLTPASFEQMVLELRFLGLLDMECVEVSGPAGNEFYAHLRNAPQEPLTEEAFYTRREALMRRAIEEMALRV